MIGNLMRTVVVLGGIILGATQSLAFNGGITTSSFGSSGCNSCHSGGSVPTVTLSGPTSVLPASTNTYTLTISTPGSQTHGGLNVSAALGTLAVGGPDSAQTQAPSGEITHLSRKMSAGGVTTFSFTWTAPIAFSTAVLNGWGNAVDANFGPGGDRADDASLVISNAITPTPSPSPSPTPTATLPPPLCSPAPQTCATAAKSSLSFTNNADDTKDAVSFKWNKGPTTSTLDFGDPTVSTHYALCIYQNGTLHMELDAPASNFCNGKPCWAASSKGFKYKDKLATPNGLTAAGLAVGAEAGKAKVQVKGKGALLADPGSIPMAVPVIAQVVNSSNANCWGATWSPAEIKNDGVKFKAKSN